MNKSDSESINRRTEKAWEYHNSTKHPGMPSHTMDWENQPVSFKIYTDLPAIEVPKDLELSQYPTLAAIAKVEDENSGEEDTPDFRTLDFRTLGRLLFLAGGITRKVDYGGNEVYFRAAACTGALYHIDLYVATQTIGGLEAGLYQFDPRDFSFKQLRKGDYRGVIAEASGNQQWIKSSPASVILTSTFWRNAWKYQARAYRHSFWDSGTITANLLAAAAAYDIPCGAVMGFEDSKINNLLDINPLKEASICLVPLGRTNQQLPDPPLNLPRLNHETIRLSKHETMFPLIASMHSSSSMKLEEVLAWRETKLAVEEKKPAGTVYKFEIDKEFALELMRSGPIEETIVRRISTRDFSHDSITLEDLSRMLFFSTRRIKADFLSKTSSALNNIYLIANDVEGLPKGAYHFSPRENHLELIKDGDFREKAGELALGQELAAEADVNIFFMTDLNKVLEVYGNRGYRAAQFEAAMRAGKIYLAAEALKLGATGLTFFDDDVTEFFSPHSSGMSVMFLLAVGKPIGQ